MLQEKILRIADFSLLDTFMHCNETCEEIIKNVLEKAMSEGKITDYFLWLNKGRTTLGVSNNADIVLYRARGEIYKYDTTTSLFPKLLAQRSGCLWMYVYVCLPLHSEEKCDRILDELFEKIVDSMSENIKAIMNALFDLEKIKD